MLGDWFATGDRYERAEDGTYAYVGRVDDMLKVGGLWVSPVDMEHALMEHPRVAGVGVVGVRVDDASRIAAYVQCTGEEPGNDVLAEELRAWCKERMRRISSTPTSSASSMTSLARSPARCSGFACASGRSRPRLRARPKVPIRHRLTWHDDRVLERHGVACRPAPKFHRSVGRGAKAG